MEDFAKLDGTARLQKGLAAAASGDRTLARQLFLEVAHEFPAEELAWICLAEISDNLTERIANLRSALAQNPSNARTRALLAVARRQLAARLVEIVSRKSHDAYVVPVLLAASDLDPANELILSKLLHATPEIASSRITGYVNEPAPASLSSPPESPAVAEEGPLLRINLADFEPAHQPLSSPPNFPEVDEEDRITIDDDPITLNAADFEPARQPLASPWDSLEVDEEGRITIDDDPISVNAGEFEPANSALELGLEQPFDIFSQTATSETVRHERKEQSSEDAPLPTTRAEDPFAPVSAPEPSKTASRHSFILSEGLAGAGACSFCMEPLSEDNGRCVVCGGTTTIRDPRLDDTINRVDPRLMLVAVNRLTLVVKRSRQDARAHFELGMAYLNLNRTDAALRWLTKAQELQPDAQLEAGLKTLSGPPAQRSTAAHASGSPNMGFGNGTIPSLPRQETSADLPISSNEDEYRGRVVLVVDDSATVRRMITTILERKGYRVITAVDGDDGLNKMREHPIDLVLLDVTMPKLDGYQVCKTIRAGNKVLPIVMLSGKDGFFDRVRGKVAGSSLYMTKPFEPAELLKIVAQYCDAERNAASS